jgi:multidrug resistance efflux pump
MTEMEDRLAKLFDEKFKSLFDQLEAVATVKTQISELDAKLTDQAGRIEQVQAKVDLTMTSVANLQQEQL